MRNETKTRLEYSTTRLKQLREHLGEAQEITGDLACVYATGSYGRIEANRHSDLDVFIVGISKAEEDKREQKKREVAAFPRLEEICLKAKLIEVCRELKFEDFSGDGEYLVHYPLHETAPTQEELIEEILSKTRRAVLPSLHLSEAVFKLIQELGQSNKLHRQIVV